MRNSYPKNPGPLKPLKFAYSQRSKSTYFYYSESRVLNSSGQVVTSWEVVSSARWPLKAPFGVRMCDNCSYRPESSLLAHIWSSILISYMALCALPPLPQEFGLRKDHTKFCSHWEGTTVSFRGISQQWLSSVCGFLGGHRKVTVSK